MISLTTLFLILINFFIALVLLLKRNRKPGEPPLVHHRIPYFGAAFAFGRDSVGYLKKLQSKLGDVFTIKLAGWNYIAFMDPLDAVRLEKNKDLKADEVLCDFTTCMVGKHHSIHKKKKDSNKSNNSKESKNLKYTDETTVPQTILNNLRGSSQLQDLYRSCVRTTDYVMNLLLQEKLDLNINNNQIGLFHLCKVLIFHLTYNILFGTLPDEEENLCESKKLMRLFMRYNENSVLLPSRVVPRKLLVETNNARKEIFEMFKKFDWSKRLATTSEVIKQILNVDKNEENQVGHLLIVFWAAQTNTAPSLFWFLFYILTTPDLKEKIMKEFDDYVEENNPTSFEGANNKIKTPTDEMNRILQLSKADLDKLYILDSIFKETTRIAGSSVIARKATKDTSITTFSGKTFQIRKNDLTMFYSPILHLDPKIYENPNDFKFDRFLEENISKHDDRTDQSVKSFKTRTKFYKEDQRINASRSILTFGFGEQRCPGRHLAAMEIKILTLSLLKCFDMELQNHEKPKPDASHVGFGVMPPKIDVSMSFNEKNQTKYFNYPPNVILNIDGELFKR